jgi:TonB family protein
MRAALCLGLILIGSAVAFAERLQPAPSPHHHTFTPAEAARAAAYTPRIQYPLAALARGIHGTGMFGLHVSLQTGRVKSLEIVHSTGHAILDTAATSTLGRWLFKPERLQALADSDDRRSGQLTIRVPVTYVSNGGVRNPLAVIVHVHSELASFSVAIRLSCSS